MKPALLFFCSSALLVAFAACAAPSVGTSPSSNLRVEDDEDDPVSESSQNVASPEPEPVEVDEADEIEVAEKTSKPADAGAAVGVKDASAPLPAVRDAGASDAGASCIYGNGLYCGGNGVSGGVKTLYRCEDGVPRLVIVCKAACKREAPGVNDHCE